MSPTSSTAMNTIVLRVRTAHHGYPYQGVCTCGWESRPYAAVHAARDMAEDHRDVGHRGQDTAIVIEAA